MVIVTPAPIPWDPATVALYQTNDSLLGNFPVFVFYGPSVTTNTTLNSSRIQAHIFSLAGYQSFPRLTISPTSPLYAAVKHLPEEKQGDETARGLAISLFKYYAELPSMVRRCLVDMAARAKPEGSSATLFDEAHAARLVSNMVRMDNAATIASHITCALAERYQSWADLDVLVTKDIATTLKAFSSGDDTQQNQCKLTAERRAILDLLSLVGSPTFLPTSRLRRAPSRPTGSSKSKCLSPKEVAALQREMLEAMETEVTYVNKLRELELLLPAADKQDIKPLARATAGAAGEVTLVALGLHLRQIALLNGEFLHSIVQLMEETTSHSDYGEPESATPGRHDLTGAEAFAKILMSFVPKFHGPYHEYLKLSAQITRVLSAGRETETSHISAAVAQIGEKRLKSLLIEPVQRLPRYSMFIDNMVKLLPASHPAMNKFLRAKDLITEICALDTEDMHGNALILRRLREVVAQWPLKLSPEGRLITAIDANELKPPYRTKSSEDEVIHCILAVFADHIVVLRKLEGTHLSARGLMAEIQRPSHAPSTVESESLTGQHLFVYITSFATELVRVTESSSGHNVFLSSVRKADSSPDAVEVSTNFSVTSKAFNLLGPYEGKASKFSEEIFRARTENRFPDDIRDGTAWSFRVLPPENGFVGLSAAIFGSTEISTTFSSLRGRARILMVLQGMNGDKVNQESPRNDYPEADFTVSVQHTGVFCLEGRTPGGRRFVDQAPATEFLPVVLKRIVEKLRHDALPNSIETAHAQVTFCQRVLEGVRPRQRLNSTTSRLRLRPISPVKALSNIFGSGVKLTQYLTSPPVPGDESPSPSPAAKHPALPYKDHEFQNETSEDPAKSKFTVINTTESPANGSMMQLETTFNTYIVALHSRAGNIVGKSLRHREYADELTVNELYNTLIEDPSQHQAAAEVPVDILFAAFEKFVTREWRGRMGEILPARLLESLQSSFDRSHPSELSRNIKSLLSELSPQNGRVLSATVKLLFDLLEASGNDADRGALTASFAEILVLQGDPHRYISLLDRLVDDVDTFFDDVGETGVSAPGQQSGSVHRMRSTNTGSTSSAGSSLRKRFGFGMLTRENSRTDSDSRANTVWRTLSKKSSNDADSSAPNSLRGILARSKSSERDFHRVAWSRPGSADRPCSANSIQESPRSAFGSVRERVEGFNEPSVSPSATAPSRRPKRRSSLSDLQHIENHPSPFDSNSPLPKRAAQHLKSAGAGLTPAAASLSGTTRPKTPAVSINSTKKENVAPADSLCTSATLDARAVAGHRGGASKAARQPLTERGVFGDNQQSPPGPGLDRKLKSQNSQKIRERISKEATNAHASGAQLQAKLAELHHELHDHREERVETDRSGFEQRLIALERKLAASQHDTDERLTSLKKEVESSLVVSEQKCKKLDKVYQAAHVENELLYERFNTELANVFRNLQVDGLSAVVEQLQQAQGEVSRLKQDNYRLKRENIGLRSWLGC